MFIDLHAHQLIPIRSARPDPAASRAAWVFHDIGDSTRMRASLASGKANLFRVVKEGAALGAQRLP